MKTTILESLKEKTVLVIDYGNFFPVVERLARDFGRVLLYIPWEAPFPTHHKYLVGTGIPNVERVYSIWPYYYQIDLFYFCDLNMGPWQDFLRAEGRLVFGPGRGENMELYRDQMKGLQRSLGMAINPYEVIRGLDQLRAYLKEHDNKYIKTNLMRGHFESFHHESYEHTEALLDDWEGGEHGLGLYKHDEVFIVEDPIEAVAEIGYDGPVINGQYPERTLVGVEIKDCGYCGVIVDYKKLPKGLQEINALLAPTFKEFGYCGMYSNEIRIGLDGQFYLIDMTCRHPEPPTCLQLEIYENYSEMIWLIAQGIVPEIKTKFKYGVQIIIKSDWAKTQDQYVSFPEQFKHFVKLKNMYIKEGKRYYQPQPGVEMEEIGAVIGMGNTLEEAINQAKAIAKQVKGYSIVCNGDALDKATEEIEKLKKAGIKLF
jgi:hypothetical protein